MSKPLAVSVSPKACARLAPSSSLTRLLLDLTVWRALVVVDPVRRFLAYQVLLGRSVATIASDFWRLLLWTVGWLAAPPRSRALRALSGDAFTARRWHLLLGATRCQAQQCRLFRHFITWKRQI